MDSSRVKHILTLYRELKATYDVHTSMYPNDQSEAIQTLRRKITIIESWLHILTEEERFTVTQHILVDLPWPLVVVEYEMRWGPKEAKAERTLKRFQKTAIDRIVRFIQRNGYGAQITTLFFVHEISEKVAPGRLPTVTTRLVENDL